MKVKLKSRKELKKYARYLGGDMSEDIHYFIKYSDNKLLENSEDVNCSFIAKSFHCMSHGGEFLVIDHPNPISRNEYELLKGLFNEVKNEY